MNTQKIVEAIERQDMEGFENDARLARVELTHVLDAVKSAREILLVLERVRIFDLDENLPDWAKDHVAKQDKLPGPQRVSLLDLAATKANAWIRRYAP